MCVCAGVFQLLFMCAVFVMLTLAALEQNYSVQVRDLIVRLFQHSQFTLSSWQGNMFLLVVQICCHESIIPPLPPGSKFLSYSHDFMCCLESPTLGSSSEGWWWEIKRRWRWIQSSGEPPSPSEDLEQQRSIQSRDKIIK